MNKAIKRTIIKATKTYNYYFKIEDRALAYWLCNNIMKTRNNVKMVTCGYSCKEHLYELSVTYR